MRLGRPHVGEDQVVEDVQRIGAVTDLAAVGQRRAGAGLEDRAVGRVVKAVVRAADAALGDHAVLERRAAVAAALLDQAVLAAAVAEEHEVLAQDAQLERQIA